MELNDAEFIDAVAPLNLTMFSEVTELNPVPDIVTVEPEAPALCDRLLILRIANF
jgi:hypothetical protein